MKLEASLKHFSPQGMHISDDVKSTSPNRLTGTDVMAAIGTTSSRARFGLAAFLGKAGISKTDEQLAIQALAQFAIKNAPKNVRKAAGDKLAACMLNAGAICLCGILTFGGHQSNVSKLQRYRLYFPP